MLILNPNPCFSRTLHMEQFERGAVMRTESAEVRAGGKGIDAARVAYSLSRKAPLIVLMGDRDATEYSRLLSEENMDFRYTTYQGSIRVATMYLETTSPTTTIVNEEGATISDADWSAYLAEVAREIRSGEIVACMGSFPHGVGQKSIAELVEMVHKNGNLLLIDSAPHFLAYGLASGVDIVSPNLDEAESFINSTTEDFFTGNTQRGRERAEIAALKLCEMGTKIAIVHAGAMGAAIAHAGKVSFVQSPEVRVVSSVGAGDSLAAGFVLKSEEQGDVRGFDSIDWELSLQYGSATAAAACEKGRSGEVDPERVSALFQTIRA
jgi:1-phosphofructokinase